MTNMTETQFNAIPEKERMNRILEGTAYYAFLHSPKHSDKYKTDTFTITLLLDEANVEKAKSYGMEIREADKWIPGPHVMIQRKIRAGKTAEETKPDVVDAMQKEIPSTVLIGNGSKVIVKFGTYWFESARTTLFKVQVRDLVEYAGKGDGLVMDANGYKAATVFDI